MLRPLVILLILFASGYSNARESFPSLRAAVQSVTGTEVLDEDFQTSEPIDGQSTNLGIVFLTSADESYGQLFMLRKTDPGRYEVTASSKRFASSRGPHHYVEIVQATGLDRFSIQFNSHSRCGIGREIFRFALVRDIWRVSGVDRYEPDDVSCNVNFDSMHYSANFLTGDVLITKFRNGNAARTEKHRRKFPQYLLADFNPEAMQ